MQIGGKGHWGGYGFEDARWPPVIKFTTALGDKPASAAIVLIKASCEA